MKDFFKGIFWILIILVYLALFSYLGVTKSNYVVTLLGCPFLLASISNFLTLKKEGNLIFAQDLISKSMVYIIFFIVGVSLTFGPFLIRNIDLNITNPYVILLFMGIFIAALIISTIVDLIYTTVMYNREDFVTIDAVIEDIIVNYGRDGRKYSTVIGYTYYGEKYSYTISGRFPNVNVGDKIVVKINPKDPRQVFYSYKLNWLPFIIFIAYIILLGYAVIKSIL